MQCARRKPRSISAGCQAAQRTHSRKGIVHALCGGHECRTSRRPAETAAACFMWCASERCSAARVVELVKVAPPLVRLCLPRRGCPPAAPAAEAAPTAPAALGWTSTTTGGRTWTSTTLLATGSERGLATTTVATTTTTTSSTTTTTTTGGSCDAACGRSYSRIGGPLHVEPRRRGRHHMPQCVPSSRRGCSRSMDGVAVRTPRSTSGCRPSPELPLPQRRRNLDATSSAPAGLDLVRRPASSAAGVRAPDGPPMFTGRPAPAAGGVGTARRGRASNSNGAGARAAARASVGGGARPAPPASSIRRSVTTDQMRADRLRGFGRRGPRIRTILNRAGRELRRRPRLALGAATPAGADQPGDAAGRAGAR